MRSNQELKEEALRIFRAGLEAVDSRVAVMRHLQQRDGSVVVTSKDGKESVFRAKRVVVVGAGKASARMARAVEEQLGALVSEGLVVVKSGHSVPTRRVEIVEADHPVPDARGMAGARRIVELLRRGEEDTLFLCLISGGGSALLPLPASGIELAEKQRVTDLLLAAGADIGEINTVRKHISAAKGGALAREAHPAKIVTFILSDVVGDRLDVIASGPTVPDPSTYADALAVLERRVDSALVPEAIRRRLEHGTRGEVEETPKPGDPVFAACTNILVGTNAAALEACKSAAEAAGWNTLLLSSLIEGETRDVGRLHGAVAREIRRSGHPVPAPACIISGGETTVTIRGTGLGGRNQELALAAALDIAGEEGMAVLSAGTDGTDGPTDATGAIAYGDTVARAAATGSSARASLDANDAYHFFDPLEDLIRTGPTHTNVMDVRLILVDSVAPTRR